MKVTLEQLAQLHLFSALRTESLEYLQASSACRLYKRKEIVLHEGDPLPEKLHILFNGQLQVQKNTLKGKETILRELRAGDVFAAPALFGNARSPATVLAIEDCQVLTISKTALLDTIQQNPELAIQLLVIFNQRLQHLHNVIHGLVSERAVVRLAQLIRYSALEQGTESTAVGKRLRIKLPYLQIARSVGITYEECARLMKGLNAIVQYSRGGTIVIHDWDRLKEIAAGEDESN